MVQEINKRLGVTEMGVGQATVLETNVGDPLDSDISKTQDEIIQQELGDLKFQLGKTKLKSYQQDIIERKKYANRIFLFVVCWSVVVVIILLIQGFGVKFNFFNLSDKVLISLISATTINVLGVFVIVAKYLFPESSKQTNA